MFKSLSLVSCFLLAGSVFGCGDDSDDDSDDAPSRAVIERKCEDMCEHLMDAPLAGCGRSDAATLEECVPECVEHVIPPDEDEPEATERDLDCAIDAATCDEWEACGDLL